MTDSRPNDSPTSTPATTNPGTPISRPRLSEKLAALLKSQDNPIIGPKTATELRNWLTAQPEPAMATTDDVDEHVTALSLVLKERPGTTKLEAGARLDLYARALKGVAKADLARGTDDLLRTMTFMPTPAEVLKAANKYAARREFAHFRARQLIRDHEAKWKPPLRPEDMASPEEVAALMKKLAADHPSERDGCERVATGGEA